MSDTATLLPIRIVHQEEQVNLLHVSHNQRVLEKRMLEYEKEYGRKLRHCEAIVYCNKAYDKFRLIVSFYGVPILMLPPVDPEKRLSLYLNISQFLRKFSSRKAVTDFLDREIEEAQERLERSERVKLARKALKRRANNG